MIVRTLEQRFAVLSVLRSTENEEISVCRDLEDESAGLFTLAKFRDPALKRYLLPLLVRQQENPAFEDYLGLFTQDGDLYARFRYTRAPTLTQRLERGNSSFRERLEIGGNLLERMALLNMPPTLQFEALRPENVTVDDALRVRFNYVMQPMYAGFNVSIGFLCVQVEEILRGLFATELSARAVPELEKLLETLTHAGFSTYLELYAGYDGVRKQLQARELVGSMEPHTRLFRFWAKLKGLTRFIRPLLTGLVLVAAFCYLIYTLLLPPIPPAVPTRFDHIGTVTIENGPELPRNQQ